MEEEKTITTAAEDLLGKAETDKGKKGKTDKRPRGKKREFRTITRGRVYVNATYNNTLLSATDEVGNVLAWSSAGKMGFKGPKKATPYAATTIAKDLAEKVGPYGLKDVNVFIRGIGPGREAAVRGLHAAGINVLGIKDITPVPHNGCRQSGPRRV